MLGLTLAVGLVVALTTHSGTQLIIVYLIGGGIDLFWHRYKFRKRRTQGKMITIQPGRLRNPQRRSLKPRQRPRY